MLILRFCLKLSFRCTKIYNKTKIDNTFYTGLHFSVIESVTKGHILIAKANKNPVCLDQVLLYC